MIKTYTWEDVLTAAFEVQQILKEYNLVLVGGTASAVYANHRISLDADHVLKDLKSNFDTILKQLENISGWKTNKIQPPVLILGSLNGVETGIRQLIRTKELETKKIRVEDKYDIVLPTEAEMLRIKAILILKRNTYRDYLDFLALSEKFGKDLVSKALMDFDTYYPQKDDASALLQLTKQLFNLKNYEFKDKNILNYKDVATKWKDEVFFQNHANEVAFVLFQELLPPDMQEHFTLKFENKNNDNQNLVM